MSVLLYVGSALAVYFGLAAVLMALSPVVPRSGFYGRLLASYFCLFSCAAYGVVISPAFRLVGFGGASQWAVARAYKWMMYLSTGIFFDIEGKENLQDRPVVYVGNHQSELDVLMLAHLFPPFCSVTAKKSLGYIPIFGWFLMLSRTVFIDRSNRSHALAAFDGAAAEMRKHRQSVFIFPEGTRSYYAEPDLLPFKKGAFHLAVKAKVPIVPVVVANYAHVLHVQSHRFEAGHIPVRVLPPIPTADLTSADVDELVKDTRDRMLAELMTLTEEARAQSHAASARKMAVPAAIGGASEKESGSQARPTANGVGSTEGTPMTTRRRKQLAEAEQAEQAEKPAVVQAL